MYFVKTIAGFFLLFSPAFANPPTTLKPDLFLLTTYNKQEFTGWIMSEKYDGIRGFWDGKQLFSRGGQVINAPKWFTRHYPPFAIDGELWTKRNDFENISSIVRTQVPDNRWHQITHQIFEVPNQSGGLLDRLTILQTYLSQHPTTPIHIIKQTSIKQKSEVKYFLHQVISQGGEGVVVRNPNTPYQTGRLKSALKVKPYFDTECLVIEILTGKGKYRDKMGSLLCTTNTKKQVKIGSGFTDRQRQNPPKIGDKITFKYYGFTKKGSFKYPVFLRIKH